MFDEVKTYLSNRLAKQEPLSIVPSTKAVPFDVIDVSNPNQTYSPRIASILGGQPTWSAEPVSLSAAMQLSTVYACNAIISESVGFLPLVMHQRNGDTTEIATSHPMYNALVYEPNAEQTAQHFRELLTSHCVMSGDSFAQIVRRSGTQTALELEPILPGNIRLDRDAQQRMVYTVAQPGNSDRSYTVQTGKPHDILHIRGLGWNNMRGHNLIQVARQSFGIALSQEKNVGEFYRNGGRVPYALNIPQPWANEQEGDNFARQWAEVYSQPHKVPMLENGVTYQQIGISAKDAQLLESRQYTIPEICRWFSVSPHLVGDLSRATFSNVESLADQFVKFTLSKWLTRWELDCRRCLLTPDEKQQGYYFAHDLSALLKADFAARMAGYATMLQNGICNHDEVRAREGLNPIPGGSEFYMQLNMAPIGTEDNGNRIKITG